MFETLRLCTVVFSCVAFCTSTLTGDELAPKNDSVGQKSERKGILANPIDFSKPPELPAVDGPSESEIRESINLGVQLTYAAPFAAARRVIDVSGDGIDNVDYSPHRARNAAVALGVTVNGLAILNEIPDLGLYYRATVVGGPGAFVINASDYDAYPAAILRKLIREINRGFLS